MSEQMNVPGTEDCSNGTSETCCKSKVVGSIGEPCSTPSEPLTNEKMMANVMELAMIVNRLQSEMSAMGKGINQTFMEMMKNVDQQFGVVDNQMTELKNMCSAAKTN